MKLKLSTSLAGLRHCFVTNDVILREDDEGQRLIDAGFAVLAPDDAEVTAFEPDPEPEIEDFGGTFACPICAVETPHGHTADEIAAAMAALNAPAADSASNGEGQEPAAAEALAAESSQPAAPAKPKAPAKAKKTAA
jgi:hypothetical protein